MENFDIEKLPRKNIYKTPDFFAEMQAEVLQKTVYNLPSSTIAEPKKSNKNWLYAAAVAIIAGSTWFMMPSRGAEKSIPVATNATQTTTVDQPTTVEEIQPETQQSQITDNAPEVEPVATPQTERQTLNKSTQRESFANNAPVAASHKTIDLDQVASQLSASDIADLEKNTDQDIYLELYQ